jgi:hypothetical protein
MTPLTDVSIPVTAVVLVAVNMPATPANSIGAGRSAASEGLNESKTTASVAGFAASCEIVVVPHTADGTRAKAMDETATPFPAPDVPVSSHAAAPFGADIAFVATWLKTDSAASAAFRTDFLSRFPTSRGTTAAESRPTIMSTTSNSMSVMPARRWTLARVIGGY